MPSLLTKLTPPFYYNFILFLLLLLVTVASFSPILLSVLSLFFFNPSAYPYLVVYPSLPPFTLCLCRRPNVHRFCYPSVFLPLLFLSPLPTNSSPSSSILFPFLLTLFQHFPQQIHLSSSPSLYPSIEFTQPMKRTVCPRMVSHLSPSDVIPEDFPMQVFTPTPSLLR